jgi:hypothetical protein
MPGPVDMPLVISQMTHVQKVFNAELVKSELQNALVINPNDQEINKNAQKQIQKIEKKDGSNAISDHKEGAAQQHSMDQRKNRKEKSEKEDDEPPVKTSPWSGNIINVKI